MCLLTIYAMAIVVSMEINNRVLMEYIIQNIICFFIVDAYEQRYIQIFYEKYKNKPKTTIHEKMPSSLIESYIQPRPKERTDLTLSFIQRVE